MSELDRAIIRLAVSDAKRRIGEGCLLQDAAANATPGVWQEYRLEVLSELLEHYVAQKETADKRANVNHNAAAQ